MRTLATYVVAALAIGTVLDFVAPSIASVGVSSTVWPTVDRSIPIGGEPQLVNRSGKADRLNVSHEARQSTRTKTQNQTVRDVTPPAQVRPIPEGCDPAFSPLSASARLNYASRCMASFAVRIVTPA